MTIEELKARTFRFGVETARMVERLLNSTTTRSLGNQLLRSATSVGANYRAACRAKSQADFVSKMKIVEEECDEALYWLDMLTAGGWLDSAAVTNLIKEGNEILAIVVASIKTARSTRS